MERVARVMITAADTSIEEWAKEEEQTAKEIVSEIKGGFEDFIKGSKKKLCAKMEFIEWEDFCPKCESTFI